jgi:hypothetical protein
VKDNFRSSLAYYFFHLRQIRKIGLPPLLAGKLGWTPRVMDGMYLCSLLAQAKA